MSMTSSAPSRSLPARNSGPRPWMASAPILLLIQCAVRPCYSGAGRLLPQGVPAACAGQHCAVLPVCSAILPWADRTPAVRRTLRALRLTRNAPVGCRAGAILRQTRLSVGCADRAGLAGVGEAANLHEPVCPTLTSSASAALEAQPPSQAQANGVCGGGQTT